MNKQELTEYTDCLLKIASAKCGSCQDAEDIVSETLLSALAAIKNGAIIENPKAFLTSLLNRRYCDLLRRKYRRPSISIETAGEIRSEEMFFEKIEKSEEAEEIRREVAYLASIYREITVRFYMHGESVREISAALNIPENTVKTRLRTGRRHIGSTIYTGKDCHNMENYSTLSYEPEQLWLCSSGQSSLNGEPFSLVGNDRIAMNILILAYEKPLTVTEIAKSIGIAAAYIEPIIERLENGELMKRVGDRLYTDFIIWTEHDRTVNLDLELELADKHFREIFAEIENGISELKTEEFYTRQNERRRSKLEHFFAVRTLLNAVCSVRNECCGGAEPFYQYPDRPNGGKWYAMGNRIPAHRCQADCNDVNYGISGEYVCTLNDYCGCHSISYCEYSNAIACREQRITLSPTDLLKMLYALHTGDDKILPVIGSQCVEQIDDLIKIGYVTRENGKAVTDLPAVTRDERYRLYDLSEKWDNIISEKFREILKSLMKNPVVLPSHLKSVPNWLRYMQCCDDFTMAVLLKAKENGLFLKDTAYPAPAAFLVIDR